MPSEFTKLEDIHLTTQQLRAVLAVANCGSFVAAAPRLSISQSSLSRIVQGTEEALNVALFSRSTRKVELTAAGQEFIQVAQRILNDLDIALANMADIAALRRGRVIVSTIQSVALGYLTETVTRYSKDFQGIEIHIREGVQELVEMDVRSGVADLGICAIDGLEEVFWKKELLVEQLHAILPPGHALADRSSLALSEIADERFVSLPQGAKTRELIDFAASSRGLKLKHPIVSSSLSTIVSLVARGAGVAVVPSGVLPLAWQAQLKTALITDQPLSRRLGVIRLMERALPPAVSGFLEYIQPREA